MAKCQASASAIPPVTGDKGRLRQALGVLHLKQMSNTLTVRLSQDLAEWLDQAARRSGVSRGGIVRMELERARKPSKQPFLRLAGAVEGPADLSMRKGFSRK